MRKSVLLLLMFLMSFSVTNAQVKIVKEISLNDTLPISENLNSLAFKFHGDIVCCVRSLPEDNSNNLMLIIARYNILTGEKISLDTLFNIPETCSIHDIAVTKDNLLLTGIQKYILFNFNTKERHMGFKYISNLMINPSIPPMKSCEFLNDSIAAMYIIYNYNPNDERPGIYISTFNINSKKFEKSLYEKFKGVGISYINRNWLTVANGRIFTITPLSGQLTIYDNNLKFVKDVRINIFDSSSSKDNRHFEMQIDSISYADVGDAGNDSATSTKVYAESIYQKLDSMDGYIDGLFTIDKQKIGLSVFRAEYGEAYRDFIVYDTEKFSVDTTYKKWNCGASEMLKKPEDLFPIIIYAPKTTRPHFQDGHIYNFALMPMSTFEPSHPEKLAEKVFNSISKYGYPCSILKYDFTK